MTKNQYNKSFIIKHVSEKLKERHVTVNSLLVAIKNYKDYPFKGKKEDLIESSVVDPAKLNENEATFSATNTKMECMPEIKEFEKILASIDKTQTVEKRIYSVLFSMGLSELYQYEQEKILEVAIKAIKKKDFNFTQILGTCATNFEEATQIRMTFSKFINNYVQKYAKGEQVKVSQFLSELQKIIMLENEL